MRACVCCGVCVRVRVLRCVSACVRVLRCVRTSFSFQLLPLALCPPGCCCACARACVRGLLCGVLLLCVRAGAAACCGVFVRACVRACVHVLHFAPRVLLCVVRALQCVSACGACVCYGACVRRVLQCVRACMPACVCPQCVRTSFSPVPGWVDSSVGERPPAVFFAPAGRGGQAGSPKGFVLISTFAPCIVPSR